MDELHPVRPHLVLQIQKLSRNSLSQRFECHFLVKVSLIRPLVHIAYPDLEFSLTRNTKEIDPGWRQLFLQIYFQVLEYIAMSIEVILAR